MSASPVTSAMSFQHRKMEFRVGQHTQAYSGWVTEWLVNRYGGVSALVFVWLVFETESHESQAGFLTWYVAKETVDS